MQRWPLTILMSATIGLAGAGQMGANMSDSPAIGGVRDQSAPSPDVEYLVQAGQACEAEIALASLAQKHGADARIKSLGILLKSDHEMARTELQKLAKLKKAELTAMTVAQLAVHSRLEKMTGADFDRAWAEAIIELHRDTRGLFSRASRSADLDIKAFATVQAKILEEHLKRAKGLQGIAR